MSWTAFLPDNVAQHPERFVGPNVAGVIVQSLETGILVNQSFRFWSRSRGEPRVTKLLVAFVSCVAVFQTLIAVYNTWRVVVLGFGNVGTAVDLGWADRIQPALNCIMAAPFQALLIWRCWNVLHRRWIILAPLVTLLLANVIFNVYITVNIFFISSITVLLNGPPRLYITAFVLSAVLDMLITALMMWFLLRIKSQVISRHFANVLVQLHRMIWEAALPPCACAIAACVVYITMSRENLWDVFLQSILGKLYVISFFVILNGRTDLKRSLPVATQSPRMSRFWANDAPVQFRVNLTTVIDRPVESQIEFSPTTEVASHVNTDSHEDKSRLSSRAHSEGGNAAATPTHNQSFEMQERASGSAETSSFVMVTKPPTVLHRNPGQRDWKGVL